MKTKSKKGAAIRLPLTGGNARSQPLENDISGGPTTTSSSGEKQPISTSRILSSWALSSAAHYDESKITRKMTNKKWHKGWKHVHQISWNHEQQYLNEHHHLNCTTIRIILAIQRLKARLDTNIIANLPKQMNNRITNFNCVKQTKPSMRTCSTEKETRHTQDRGNKVGIQPYHRQRASWKSSLWSTKSWSLNDEALK